MATDLCGYSTGNRCGSLWEHLRIKTESFDISGGWIGDHLKHEAYLQLLTRLHVNTGQIQDVAGYTDNPELYSRYPMKLFNRMWPVEQWDKDAWLPRVHAVEFLGEPQYGGGRPVAPQEVFDQLLPYRTSRLATSVTNSEERIWRYYAGLSDYPHFDAYRVVARRRMRGARMIVGMESGLAGELHWKRLATCVAVFVS